MGPGFNANQTMQVSATDTVLVSGLGPVGLGTALIALYRGARVLGLELNPYRIALAKEMGVEAVVDPTSEDALDEIMDLTDGKGAAKSVECSSVDTAPEFPGPGSRDPGSHRVPGLGRPPECAGRQPQGTDRARMLALEPPTRRQRHDGHDPRREVLAREGDHPYFSFQRSPAGAHDQGEQPVREGDPAPMGELRT